MNREIVLSGGGAGIYPLTGDILSTAGSPTVRVTGIQGIPVLQSVVPSGAMLQYNQNNNRWEATLNAQIQVNGITVSGDPWVSVNAAKPITVNGV